MAHPPNRGAVPSIEKLEARLFLSVTNLVGAWMLDDGSGATAADSSGNNYIGTLVGSPGWTSGKINGALSFNGVDQRVVVSDNADLDITGTITLSAWIQPSQAATQYVLKKAHQASVDGYELGLSSGGTAFVRFNQTTSADTFRIDSTSQYPTDGNTWMHLAATYDGATIKLYVNGNLQSSAAKSFSIATNNLGLGIGAEDGGFRPFKGKLDEVQVYNRALSASEVRNLANTAPNVSAGPDQAITISSAVNLDGTVTDDGLPNPPASVSNQWVAVSGPGIVTFGNSNAVDTTATFSATGVYTLRLTANDGSVSASDDAIITVGANTPGNQAPSVSAGPDQAVTLSAGANLDGTVTDDGLPNPPATVTSQWVKVSGPGTVTFGNSNSVDTSAAFSATGAYTLRLTADDSSLATSDDVIITVAADTPINHAPLVNAGPDQTLSSPSNVALHGTVTDDGLPNPPGAVTSSWVKVSGPGTVTFGNSNSADTTASFSQAGSYVLSLSANDGALTSSDTATITITGSISSVSLQSLNSVGASANTGEKPQSKLWVQNGTWFTVLPTDQGTYLFRLDGNSWTRLIKLSNLKNIHADVKDVGNVTHVLLYHGGSTNANASGEQSGFGAELVSLEYVAGSPGNYQLWSVRPGTVTVPLSTGVETATIDVDSTGRMWMASDSNSAIQVRYSDGPYTSWSSPITLASNVSTDDISSVIAMPNGKVGVFWSNHNSKRFGFRTHQDGASPSSWGADEVPASQSAQNFGDGMADDHMNLKVASDGTLYVAIKTGYDTSGQTEIGLLVRRPTGSWDSMYRVDTVGTRPIVLLDEADGSLTVVYTNDNSVASTLVYRRSRLSSISFGSKQTLISGSINNVTTTKQNVTNEAVFLATSGSSTVVGTRMTFNGVSSGAAFARTQSASSSTSLASASLAPTTSIAQDLFGDTSINDPLPPKLRGHGHH